MKNIDHTLLYDIYYLLSLSTVTWHLSPVTCHLSPISCLLSPVTCHLSTITCLMSPVTCHLFSVTWVSWLSKITENFIFHGNFSVEIPYKVPKRGYFWQNKILSQKQIIVSQKLSVTEARFLCRNKFISQKQVYFQQIVTEASFLYRKKFIFQKKVYFTETSLFPKKNLVRGKISLRKPIYITKTNFCPSLFQRNPLLSQKKVLVAEKLLPWTKVYVRKKSSAT